MIDRLIEGAPTFLRFCEILGITLEPGQRAMAMVAFDGLEPRDLPPPERDLARQMFGQVDVLPPGVRKIVVLICGARAGKTFLGAIRLLYLALFLRLDKLQPGQEGKCWIVAPELDLATEGLNAIRGQLEENPRLRPLLLNPPKPGVRVERLVIRRDNDRKLVAFEIKAAKRMGVTERGRVILAAMLDEAAFFFDESHVVNDVEIFNALQPRVMVGGQLLIPTTPWAESGLAYDLCKANHPAMGGAPSSALAALAPTPLFRSDPDILEQVATAVEVDRQRGTSNAQREFFCKFLSTSAASFFAPDDLAAAIAAPGELPDEPPAGARVGAGGDVGLVKNSSAIAVALRVGHRLQVPVLQELHPDQGQALKPSEVWEMFASTLKRWGAWAIALDQAERESAREDLGEAGLTVVNAASVMECMAELRTALRERRIKMVDDPLLREQLRSIRIRPRPGGGESLVVPTTPDGRHCDRAVALATAVFEAWHRGAEVRPASTALDLDEDEQAILDEQEAEARTRLAWILRPPHPHAEQGERGADRDRRGHGHLAPLQPRGQDEVPDAVDQRRDDAGGQRPQEQQGEDDFHGSSTIRSPTPMGGGGSSP